MQLYILPLIVIDFECHTKPLFFQVPAAETEAQEMTRVQDQAQTSQPTANVSVLPIIPMLSIP